MLNCAAGQGDATFILTDPDVADRDQLEVSVFDMLFPILRDHTLSSVANVPDMAGVGPATGTSAYSGIAKDAAILAKPGESAIAPEAPPCDIEVIWCFTWSATRWPQVYSLCSPCFVSALHYRGGLHCAVPHPRCHCRHPHFAEEEAC